MQASNPLILGALQISSHLCQDTSNYKLLCACFSNEHLQSLLKTIQSQKITLPSSLSLRKYSQGYVSMFMAFEENSMIEWYVDANLTTWYLYRKLSLIMDTKEPDEAFWTKELDLQKSCKSCLCKKWEKPLKDQHPYNSFSIEHQKGILFYQCSNLASDTWF